MIRDVRQRKRDINKKKRKKKRVEDEETMKKGT